MSNLKQKRCLVPVLGLLIILSTFLYVTPAVHAKNASYSVTNIPVGNDPVPEVYDPVNGNLYVGNSGSGTVSVIDSTSNTVIATVVVGTGLANGIWNPANGNVYFCNQGSATVSVISSATNTVIATVSTPPQPHNMAFDFANGDVYVGSDGSNLVTVISSETNTVLALVAVGLFPGEVTYDFANNDIYASNFLSNTVSRIDSSTNTVTATIAVGVGPGHSAFDFANGNMYVPNTGSNTVSVISSATDAVLATVPVGSAPNPTFYDPANRNIFVTNRGSNFVSVINSRTNTVMANVPVGPNPFFATYNPLDKDMFVTDHGSNTVSVIDSSTLTVIATIVVGSNPHFAVFDFTNGEMYVSNEGSNTVSAISISHPTPGTWTTEAPRPVTAEGLGAAVVGSTVFAIGGGPFPSSCHNDAYDTTKNTWSSKAPMPVCVAEPAGIVSVGGLIYVISGGCQAMSPCPSPVGVQAVTPAVQIYDPRTDTWSMGAPIPTPRLRAGTAVHDGKIYVIGGYNGGIIYNVVEVYDVVTNTWATVASMPTFREGLLAATVGDNIFAIGGFTVPRNQFSATGLVEEYNIATDTWTSTGLTPMPTPRGTVYAMAGVACGNDPIFVIGGANGAGASNANEAYLPSLNEWIERPPMPTARGEAGSGIVGSQIFVIGGTLAGQGPPDTNANEMFQCPNTVAGTVTSGGVGVEGVTVTVSDGNIPIGTVLTAADGFYDIDLLTGGTYRVSVTTLTGTAAATVSVPQGTITIQNLTT